MYFTRLNLTGRFMLATVLESASHPPKAIVVHPLLLQPTFDRQPDTPDRRSLNLEFYFPVKTGRRPYGLVFFKSIA